MSIGKPLAWDGSYNNFFAALKAELLKSLHASKTANGLKIFPQNPSKTVWFLHQITNAM